MGIGNSSDPEFQEQPNPIMEQVESKEQSNLEKPEIYKLSDDPEIKDADILIGLTFPTAKDYIKSHKVYYNGKKVSILTQAGKEPMGNTRFGIELFVETEGRFDKITKILNK